MNPEIIFAIPFVVLIVFVIRQFFLYEKEMKAWIKEASFTVVTIDDLPYVVPTPRPVTSED